MPGRTQKEIGRALEARIRSHGWNDRETLRLEAEFWEAGKREARPHVASLRIAIFTIATERGASLEQAVEAVREAEAS